MNATPSAPMAPTQSPLSEQELLDLESQYCSWGDTVHYAEKLDIFTRAAGNCLYDAQGTEYFDLQMWYSAVNFGYGNQRLNDALKRQIDTPKYNRVYPSRMPTGSRIDSNPRPRRMIFWKPSIAQALGSR